MLERLAAAWRRRYWAAVALAAVATALLGGALGGALGWGLVPGAAAGALLVAMATWLRRPRMDARTAARHLNRAWPTLEESAELLVRDADALSPLERLQRERTARALDHIAHPTLPHRPWRLALWYAGVAVAGAAALLSWSGGEPVGARTVAPGQPARRPPALGDAVIEVHPPEYTGKRVRRTRGWDVEAEAGSTVQWTIAADGAGLRASLVFSSGDTLELQAASNGFTGAQDVARSALYYVTLSDSTGAALSSDFHPITVTPDASPTITVLSPEPRTVIQPGAPSAVAVRVLVGDDYGIAATRLIATLTTGQGEGVKFREQELSFDRSAARPDRRPGALLERVIDARAFGLGPGDELYFHIVTQDIRRPVPNETRSETYFVSLADTARAMLADFSGLAIDLTPEYFRSQRQIIIDTERLLADRNRLTVSEFRARSENIGLDQHLLRLRYGEIVGDEVVEGETDPQVAHEHDVEENATRLAPQVKATLQAALAQMWDAELRLRMSDPQAALPYEYRALELLKEVQQAARVYVRRVGFEPPPLEPDRKRLTGDLSKIGRPSVMRAATGRDSLPGIRAALEVVREGARADQLTILERAGQELAALAVAEPGRHLKTLQLLRELIEHSRTPDPGTRFRDLGALEGGLLRALPAPSPTAGAAPAPSPVARRYFDLLRAP